MPTAAPEIPNALTTPALVRLGRPLLIVFGLATLWAFTHRFLGLALDGELYAVQALARLQPQLLSDLYLQNTTQDQYTIFSPIYAFFIRHLGLVGAATLLYATCSLWMLAASKALASRVFDYNSAWLSLAAVIVVGGAYGPFSVFNFSENYVTARSLAEAIVVSAMALNIAGWRQSSFLLATLALFIHPIMALPGLLFVICLSIPRRWVIAGATAGLLSTLIGAWTVSRWATPPPLLRIIAGDWYEVVLERSQFLFIQHWDRGGYETAIRAFVCLLLTYLAHRDSKVRQFCFVAIVVGLSGLGVNAVASFVAPVALLVQGQPWRWMWITTLCAVVALPPTVLAVLKDPRVGWICALALVLGWVYGEVDGAMCCGGALLLWTVREQVTPRVERLLKIGAGLASCIVIAEILGNAILLQATPQMEAEREPLWVSHVREVFGLGIPSVLFAIAIWTAASRLRRGTAMAIALIVTGASAAFMIPKALATVGQLGTPQEIAQFSAWQQRIPPRSTVLLYPPRRSAAFIWFTLQRPSYMSVDQSAGVVFSSQTAAEIKRRSEMLMPIADPDWRIYSLIEHGEIASKKALSSETLTAICQDPILGFVIAPQKLGLDEVPFQGRGVFSGWNLYSCAHIRGIKAP